MTHLDPPRRLDRLAALVIDHRLWSLARAHPRALVTTITLQIAASITYWAQAAALAFMLTALVHSNPSTLAAPLLGLVGCIVVRLALTTAHARSAARLGDEVRAALRARLLTALLSPARLYDADDRLGARRLALTDGVDGIDAYVTRYIAAAIQVWVLCPVVLVAVAIITPWAALVLAACLGMAILGPRAWRRALTRRGAAHWDGYERLSADHLESLRSMSTLRVLGAVQRRRHQLADRSAELHRVTVATMRLSLVDTGVIDLGIQVGTAAAAALAALHALGYGATPMSTYLVLLLTSEAFRPVRELARHWHAGYLGLSAVGSLEAILAPTNIDPVTPLPPVRGDACEVTSLALDDVTFRYGNGSAILRSASVSVHPGELTVLTGASGTGKSTALDLLLGLLRPERGTIHRPPQVAVVSQRSYLFPGTVAQTLRTGAPDADEAALWTALADVGLERTVRSWPRALDTPLGEAGHDLSGGQRQRLAIARALLARADALLLDEPTSALDPVAAAIVCETLRAQARERIVLMIAHRPEAVAAADRVLRIEDGAVIEVTTPHEAAERPHAPGSEATERAVVSSDPERDDMTDYGSSAWRDLARLLPPLRSESGALAWTAVVNLVASTTLVLLSVVTTHIVATAVIEHRLDDAPWWWAAFGLALARPVLTWHEMDVSHSVAYRVLAALRMALYDGYARGVPSRRGIHSGRLAGVAMTDVEKLEFFYAHTVAQVVSATVLVAVALPVLARVSLAVAIAVASGSVALVIVSVLLQRSSNRLGADQQHRRAELSARVVDILAGTREILVLGHRDRAVIDVGAAAAAVDIPARRIRMLEAAGAGARDAIVILTTVLVVVLAGTTTSVPRVWLPCLLAGALAVLAPVADAVTVAATLQPLRASARRVADGIDLGRLGPDRAVTTPDLPALDPSVAVATRSTRVRFPGRADITVPDLTITAGEIVGVAGPSGVGKSTLARLLVGLWTPDEGAVLVHGAQPHEAGPQVLPRLVQLVEQEPVLLHGSLAENLRLGAPAATEDDLVRVLRTVGLPLGAPDTGLTLGTVLGEEGTTVSGGQRARIALARALLLDPRVLVLDETTASLDAAAERAVMDIVGGLSCTVVVISHRAQTLARCQRVIRWE